jgi:hypothetical protein
VSLSLFSHLQRGFPPTTDISPPPPSTLLHFAFGVSAFCCAFSYRAGIDKQTVVASPSSRRRLILILLLLGAAHLKPLIG